MHTKVKGHDKKIRMDALTNAQTPNSHCSDYAPKKSIYLKI